MKASIFLTFVSAMAVLAAPVAQYGEDDLSLGPATETATIPEDDAVPAPAPRRRPPPAGEEEDAVAAPAPAASGGIGGLFNGLLGGIGSLFGLGGTPSRPPLDESGAPWGVSDEAALAAGLPAPGDSPA